MRRIKVRIPLYFTCYNNWIKKKIYVYFVSVCWNATAKTYEVNWICYYWTQLKDCCFLGIELIHGFYPFLSPPSRQTEGNVKKVKYLHLSLWKWHAFVNLRLGINFLVIYILSVKGYNESTLVIDDGLFQLMYTKYLCSRNMTIVSRWTHWKKLINGMQLCIQ